MSLPFGKHVMLTYGFKAIRVPIMYLSLYLTSLNMEHVYLDKVLANNESPPDLMNFVWLFVIIDFILNVGLVLIMKLLENFHAFGKDISFIKSFLLDYIMTTGIIVCFGSILTSYMQNKKYFLYQEDGMRAIRALNEMLFYFGIIIIMIPCELGIDLMSLGIAAKSNMLPQTKPDAPSAPAAMPAGVPVIPGLGMGIPLPK